MCVRYSIETDAHVCTVRVDEFDFQGSDGSTQFGSPKNIMESDDIRRVLDSAGNDSCDSQPQQAMDMTEDTQAEHDSEIPRTLGNIVDASFQPHVYRFGDAVVNDKEALRISQSYLGVPKADSVCSLDSFSSSFSDENQLTIVDDECLASAEQSLSQSQSQSQTSSPHTNKHRSISQEGNESHKRKRARISRRSPTLSHSPPPPPSVAVVAAAEEQEDVGDVFDLPFHKLNEVEFTQRYFQTRTCCV